jgi:hypothetical protein
MAQFIELLPRTKSESHGALTWEPATDNAASPVAGLLTLTGKRCHCRYRLSEFPADAGRGFCLEKIDAGSDKTEEHYSVLIAPHGNHICECRGHLRYGACKHVAAVLALIENGQL